MMTLNILKAYDSESTTESVLQPSHPSQMSCFYRLVMNRGRPLSVPFGHSLPDIPADIVFRCAARETLQNTFDLVTTDVESQG